MSRATPAFSTIKAIRGESYVGYFKKYAAEYDFDYLMLVAQGYQESGLNQNLKNPSGAVGIMQVSPHLAAAPPINVSNVDHAENNIQAGAKMMRNIADTYLDDDKLNPQQDAHDVRVIQRRAQQNCSSAQEGSR